MENVVLIIHLLLALSLIGVVLLQRSEGGGLGMGGGGAMTGRQAATALSKITWFLAIGFIITSLVLTIVAAEKSAGSSILDRLGVAAPAAEESQSAPVSPDTGGSLVPPPAADDNTLVPSAN
ncbi:preprotein translocase subunit SecG [Maritimibacter alkaliphilus]|uniref:preprotein translocase subunit SecG n=1 Tax=Maritimibacter alkaliphilus TaxID=404236 RepID=UPI001C94950C|nr:preprotein translocase subunit SecG [Maritimibacter alkaliphilus]MBY6089541.1 preprotein translocase subunit SecG [Maritimibacter alkaliphilus]